MIGRILVVDDDKDHAESIADLLNWRGYGVEAAHSGEDALELFARRPFDLTILDVKLPGINGVETFFRLRKTNWNSLLPARSEMERQRSCASHLRWPTS